MVRGDILSGAVFRLSAIPPSWLLVSVLVAEDSHGPYHNSDDQADNAKNAEHKIKDAGYQQDSQYQQENSDQYAAKGSKHIVPTSFDRLAPPLYFLSSVLPNDGIYSE